MKDPAVPPGASSTGLWLWLCSVLLCSAPAAVFMIICHPPALSGQRAWSSSSSPPEQHSVFPQEVGFWCRENMALPSQQLQDHSPSASAALCLGGRGELVVEFTAQYHPASIDVYIGKTTSDQDTAMPASQGRGAEQQVLDSGSGSAVDYGYTSAVFTRIQSSPVRLLLTSSSSFSSSQESHLQTRIALPEDASFSFIRLMVYPAVSEDNPTRECKITAVTYRPLSCHNSLSLPRPESAGPSCCNDHSLNSSGVDKHLERRRIKLRSSSLMGNKKSTSKETVTFFEIEKWKKNLLGLIPRISSQPRHAYLHHDRKKSLIYHHILEANFIVDQIVQLQEYLQKYVDSMSGVQEGCGGNSGGGDIEGLQSMVAAFNSRCATLVLRQRELLALPATHTSSSFRSWVSSEEGSGCIQAAWTPQVLGAADCVQWVYVKEFWRTRDVYLARCHPALLLPHPAASSAASSVQESHSDGLLHSKSEILTKYELTSHDICRNSSTPTGSSGSRSSSDNAAPCDNNADEAMPVSPSFRSSRPVFRGTVAKSLLAHCFCETWLKHFYSTTQQLSSSVPLSLPVASRTTTKRKRQKNLKTLSCQIKLLENMISVAADQHQSRGANRSINSAASWTISVADRLVLCSVVACQGLLRGSEALWFAALGLVSRLHTPSSSHSLSFFSRRELQGVDYAVLVYTLSLTLPAVIFGRCMVLDKYNSSSHDDEEKKKNKMFKAFQSKSLEAIDELVLLLSLNSHVGRHLLAAFLCGVSHQCLDHLLSTSTNTSTNKRGRDGKREREIDITKGGEEDIAFETFLGKIVYSFLELLLKLVIRCDFEKDTSLDRSVLQKLANKCLSLPLRPSHAASPSAGDCTSANAGSGETIPFIHASAQRLNVLCAAHVQVEEKVEAEAAAKEEAQRAQRREQLLHVQQQLVAVVAREQATEARRLRREARREARKRVRREAKQRRARDKRATSERRRKERREQHERQQQEAAAVLRDITAEHREAFMRKKEEREEEIRKQKSLRTEEGRVSLQQKQELQRAASFIISMSDSDSDMGEDASEEDESEEDESEDESGEEGASDLSEEEDINPDQLHPHQHPLPHQHPPQQKLLQDQQVGTVGPRVHQSSVHAQDGGNAEAGGGGDMDRVPGCMGRLFHHRILLQDKTTDSQGDEGKEDAVLLLLDHYLFLRPLQRLFASYSDFKLFFGVDNFHVDTGDELRDKSPPQDKKGTPLSQTLVSVPRLVGMSAEGRGDRSSDSDADIDAIVELTIHEFNKQETFRSEPVEVLTRERIRRKSLQGTTSDATSDRDAHNSMTLHEGMDKDKDEDKDKDKKEHGGGDVDRVGTSTGSAVAVKKKDKEENEVEDEDKDEDKDEYKDKKAEEREAEQQQEKTDEGAGVLPPRRRRLKSAHTDVVLFPHSSSDQNEMDEQ